MRRFCRRITGLPEPQHQADGKMAMQQFLSCVSKLTPMCFGGGRHAYGGTSRSSPPSSWTRRCAHGIAIGERGVRIAWQKQKQQCARSTIRAARWPTPSLRRRHTACNSSPAAAVGRHALLGHIHAPPARCVGHGRRHATTRRPVSLAPGASPSCPRACPLLSSQGQWSGKRAYARWFHRPPP